MTDSSDTLENIRAALAPHGLFLRGVLHVDGEGPEMASGHSARTVVLIGNVGGSLWPAFSRWRDEKGVGLDHPLDVWSEAVIRPLAASVSGEAWFPSETPWKPFQQWAMRAEGLKASPLGILIHPVHGLWHGYRGAIGFSERIGDATVPFDHHPCDHCPDKSCMPACPAGAITSTGFGYAACRGYLASDEGQSGCMAAGCLSRAACPVGAGSRYPVEQLRFHMQALSL
ncbi:ferredoxin [Rhizobium sp. SG_E_25_P2]|uniref:ferredoxin n=1 Tax=Rhizobium sp. SG_E_25_P2 TaxID=2879942 RepID=UPI00247513EE|nr:ferredoxin [Rhizobium sp. SG_E_25_P2]MDH6267315.1 ferredoxin [Rhizobium sp. SG_E_25_P2]